tara:strand:- start:30389 stop:30709 length:321 start_codon:yes stop_codon:yes gene_type:complete
MMDKVIDNKDIKKIELTYDTHCCLDLDEVFNPEDGETNPFAEGRVKGWWVKYGILYMVLDDATTIERDVSSWVVGDTLENLDTKWPTAIMLEDEEGSWHRREVLFE